MAGQTDHRALPPRRPEPLRRPFLAGKGFCEGLQHAGWYQCLEPQDRSGGAAVLNGPEASAPICRGLQPANAADLTG